MEKLKDLIGEVISIKGKDYWLEVVTNDEICLRSRIDGKLSVCLIKQTQIFRKADEILN